MTDKATECDGCGRGIPYGEQCWMVHTGRRSEDDKPIIEIKCQECYG